MSEELIPIKSVTCKDLYARDPELKKEDIEMLKEWMRKQPHLPQITDIQLMMVLHSCYYRIEESKTTLDNFFTVKKYFDTLSHELLKKTTSVALITILPKRTINNYAILMIKLLDFKTENLHCANLINLMNMVATLQMFQYGYSDGVVAIFDMKGFTLGHLGRLNLSVIKYALYFVQEAAPIRIKEVHVINAIPLIDKLMALIKPFLKGELFQALQFHPPNSETMHKTVPKELFPAEYGGSIPPSEELNETNLKNLLDNYALFKWHDAQQMDESKRIGTPRIDSQFGIDGTFKKLQID